MLRKHCVECFREYRFSSVVFDSKFLGHDLRLTSVRTKGIEERSIVIVELPRLPSVEKQGFKDTSAGVVTNPRDIFGWSRRGTERFVENVAFNGKFLHGSITQLGEICVIWDPFSSLSLG